MNETRVATVNNVAIVVTGDENQFVPVKPICEALGIDFEGQRQRINRDEILSSIAFMTKVVAADGKEREMVNLPFKYVFGWLFTIDTSRVSEEARPAVIKYKLECYDALYEHFSSAANFLACQRKTINELIDQRKEAKLNFNKAKSIFDAIERELDVVRHTTEDEWRNDSLIFELPFTPTLQTGGKNE